MLVLASALLAAVAPALLPTQLEAQSQTTPGIDPNLLAKAKSGDADAQVSLGRLYSDGQGLCAGGSVVSQGS
jgi:TPR repeat protein